MMKIVIAGGGIGGLATESSAVSARAARLWLLKRRFDPDGVFASAIPLPEG